MLFVFRHTTLIFCLSSIFGCQQVSTKAGETLDKSRQVVAQKKADIQDKVINRFDAYTADTRFNKKRFQEFFGFPPPNDVQQLYCYADRMGIDAKYQFGFYCDTITLSKIIASEHLSAVKDSDQYDFGSILEPDEFKWWQHDSLKNRVPFYRNQDNQVYTYLWYDSVKGKAWYYTYDL